MTTYCHDVRSECFVVCEVEPKTRGALGKHPVPELQSSCLRVGVYLVSPVALCLRMNGKAVIWYLHLQVLSPREVCRAGI